MKGRRAAVTTVQAPETHNHASSVEQYAAKYISSLEPTWLRLSRNVATLHRFDSTDLGDAGRNVAI